MQALLRQLFGIEAMLPKKRMEGELPTLKEAYGNLTRIAIPSVMEMVLASLIGMIDTVMVSTMGTDAVAAVGLVGQPRMLILCIFFALNTGVTAIVARRKGENRQKEANQTLKNAMTIALAISAVMIVLGLTFSMPLMRFAGAEPGRTLESANTYFRILTYTLPFQVLSMCICAAQRGVGNTKLTMYVNISSNLVNVLFNWLLINGVGPFPKLGVAGAALATAIGFCVGFVLSVISLFGRNANASFLHITMHDSWRFDKEAISGIAKISGSAMLEQIAMRIGFFSYAKIVAGLGTDAFAAHQIAMQFLNLSFTFGDGIGIAGTSLVGQMLGKKRPDLAHMYGKIAQRIAFVTAVLIASGVIIFRVPLVGMFIHSDDSVKVLDLAVKLMFMVAAFQPFQTSAVVISGALRGAGDTKYVARIMLLTVTVMRPLLSLAFVYIIGTVLGQNELALLGCWGSSLIDMITRMTLMMRRFNGGKWHDIKV